MILFIIIIAIPYLYVAWFIISLIDRLNKKQPVSWLVAGGQAFLVVIFFILHYLVNKEQLVFTGEYNHDAEHWGLGLSNMFTSTLNNLILILIFVPVMIISWLYLSSRVKNRSTNGLVDDLLRKEQPGNIPVKG